MFLTCQDIWIFFVVSDKTWNYQNQPDCTRNQSEPSRHLAGTLQESTRILQWFPGCFLVGSWWILISFYWSLVVSESQCYSIYSNLFFRTSGTHQKHIKTHQNPLGTKQNHAILVDSCWVSDGFLMGFDEFLVDFWWVLIVICLDFLVSGCFPFYKTRILRVNLINFFKLLFPYDWIILLKNYHYIQTFSQDK